MLAAARFPCFYESVFQQPGSFSVHSLMQIIHRVAEKRNPPNFACTRFSEVWKRGDATRSRKKFQKRTHILLEFIGDSSAYVIMRASVRIRAPREGQTRREVGAQGGLRRTSWFPEVAGLSPTERGNNAPAKREGDSGCGPVVSTSLTLLRGAKPTFLAAP
jgi:hypothetical protein